jgi:hypothetical protein
MNSKIQKQACQWWMVGLAQFLARGQRVKPMDGHVRAVRASCWVVRVALRSCFCSQFWFLYRCSSMVTLLSSWKAM